MGCRWIYSITVRTLLLVAGVALITLGFTEGKGLLMGGGLLLCAAPVLFSERCSNSCVKKVG